MVVGDLVIMDEKSKPTINASTKEIQSYTHTAENYYVGLSRQVDGGQEFKGSNELCRWWLGY